MKNSINIFGINVLLFALLLPNILMAQSGIRDKKVEWWEEARFGMSIHWGIYSKIAGEYLYVIARSWRGRHVLINSINSTNYHIELLNLLSFNGKLHWEQTAAGTRIEIPEKEQKGFSVYVFKVKRRTKI